MGKLRITFLLAMFLITSESFSNDNLNFKVEKAHFNIKEKYAEYILKSANKKYIVRYSFKNSGVVQINVAGSIAKKTVILRESGIQLISSSGEKKNFKYSGNWLDYLTLPQQKLLRLDLINSSLGPEKMLIDRKGEDQASMVSDLVKELVKQLNSFLNGDEDEENCLETMHCYCGEIAVHKQCSCGKTLVCSMNTVTTTTTDSEGTTTTETKLVCLGACL